MEKGPQDPCCLKSPVIMLSFPNSFQNKWNMSIEITKLKLKKWWTPLPQVTGLPQPGPRWSSPFPEALVPEAKESQPDLQSGAFSRGLKTPAGHRIHPPIHIPCTCQAELPPSYDGRGWVSPHMTVYSVCYPLMKS